jgi:hypothetical protein
MRRRVDENNQLHQFNFINTPAHINSLAYQVAEKLWKK